MFEKDFVFKKKKKKEPKGLQYILLEEIKKKKEMRGKKTWMFPIITHFCLRRAEVAPPHQPPHPSIPSPQPAIHFTEQPASPWRGDMRRAEVRGPAAAPGHHYCSTHTIVWPQLIKSHKKEVHVTPHVIWFWKTNLNLIFSKWEFGLLCVCFQFWLPSIQS